VLVRLQRKKKNEVRQEATAVTLKGNIRINWRCYSKNGVVFFSLPYFRVNVRKLPQISNDADPVCTKQFSDRRCEKLGRWQTFQGLHFPP